MDNEESIYRFLFAFILSGCDVIKNFPAGRGGVTEAEAGQGVKEILAQGVTTAVLS